ncbi:hypothetical protein HRI_003681000 [Hibiscus trionum]|uniref:Uncharacterized protein n=1 Tax=Hibiscus trionum TaxID=183268 RepID=A0A9W7ISB3_HIBTR|nr:hypothetical protein HRI_003681000 [Hibiscus trionum]
MDIVKKKWKQHMVVKVWERFCKTSRSSNGGCVVKVLAPEGCFFVCVGPRRQRFAVKTEIANHPLFRMLLEDAKLEYGFSNEGPLLLPCDVDLFNQVLAEIDDGGDREMSPICSFACSPCRRSTSTANKGYGSYKLLTPS